VVDLPERLLSVARLDAAGQTGGITLDGWREDFYSVRRRQEINSNNNSNNNNARRGSARGYGAAVRGVA
jgi:hypothetical protein